MKHPLIAITLPIALLASSAAMADTQDCATRIRALQTQIDYAKLHGNTQQAMHRMRSTTDVLQSKLVERLEVGDPVSW
ncbi:DUF1090 family protein [Burkholderia sp. NLJ2]|uniref:DUF1090 family protein n=1 Tax=Burkholderia sp. NLJ2 TaxID=3090699 RepID=UPI003C6C08A7